MNKITYFILRAHPLTGLTCSVACMLLGIGFMAAPYIPYNYPLGTFLFLFGFTHFVSTIALFKMSKKQSG